MCIRDWGWDKQRVCDAVRGQGGVRRQVKRPYKAAEDWAFEAATRAGGGDYRVNRESVVDMQGAILNMGGIYVSGAVHVGWDLVTPITQPMTISPTTLRAIRFDPAIAPTGAHAYALVG